MNVQTKEVKTYLVTVSVYQFNPGCRHILPDKLRRINPLAEGCKHPIVSVRPCMGFQRRQNVNQYQGDGLFGLFAVLRQFGRYPHKGIIRRKNYSFPGQVKQFFSPKPCHARQKVKHRSLLSGRLADKDILCRSRLDKVDELLRR